ncbi:hypothetical protein AB1Y20_005098 [Prymnesium parvum]|uniref:CSD domain-containing protein n=1 Tax=Prymnesium parvum TaxID=97485 RepID=A0AB34J390_PRYPA
MLGEEAYEVTASRKKPDDAALASHLLPVEEEAPPSEPKPDWARSWEEKKRPKLTGSCASWNKGWGFIRRDDGAADVYVHQRNILQRGFRSLLEGERVEFDLGKMPDGRVEAIKVTGPGGAKVKGQPHPKEEEPEEEAEEPGVGGKAVAEPKVKLKPYTGFMPRTVARKPPPPKPKAAAAGAAAPAASEVGSST